MSRQRLSAAFAGELGLGPKTLAAIGRFQHALREVEVRPSRPWAEVAEAAGFADQSHLHRAFRRFAGLTPGEYRSRLDADGGGLRAG